MTIKELRKRLISVIETKNSWGKNELKSVLDETIINILSEEYELNEEKFDKLKKL